MTHASHDMHPRGNGDDGKRRYVCGTCGVGATWPEAEMRCGVAFIDGHARGTAPRPPSVIVGTRSKWAAAGRPAYGSPVPCKNCGEMWQPRYGQHLVQVCGETCKRERRAKRLREWNAARGGPAERSETAEQKSERAERQRNARRAAVAT